MVLALVLLPALAGVLGGDRREAPRISPALPRPLALTLGKVVAFVALMLVVGRRLIPWVLHYVAHTGSRELFRLAVLAIALGVAFGAAELFGVSFALGAFFAGMVLARIALEPARRRGVAAAARRLRRAVLRLGRHAVRSRDPDRGSAARARARSPIIVVGKSLAAFAIVRLFGYPALDRADRLGQPRADRRVLLHPRRARRRPRASARARPQSDPRRRDPLDPAQSAALRRPRSSSGAARQGESGGETVEPEEEGAAREPVRSTALTDHVVLVGHGRVGGVIAKDLRRRRCRSSLSRATMRGLPS